MSTFETKHFVYKKVLNYELVLHIKSQIQWILNLVNCNIKNGMICIVELNKVYCGTALQTRNPYDSKSDQTISLFVGQILISEALSQILMDGKAGIC